MKKDGTGSFIAGLAICWLMNVAEFGAGWLLLAADERMLPAFYVLVGAIGLVQLGYVVPIWRVLMRKGLRRTAKGLFTGAILTASSNGLLAALILSHHVLG